MYFVVGPFVLRVCKNLKPIYWEKKNHWVRHRKSFYFALKWFLKIPLSLWRFWAIVLKPFLVRIFSSYDHVGNTVNYNREWTWPAVFCLHWENGKMTGNKILVNTSPTLPEWIQILDKTRVCRSGMWLGYRPHCRFLSDTLKCQPCSLLTLPQTSFSDFPPSLKTTVLWSLGRNI